MRLNIYYNTYTGFYSLTIIIIITLGLSKVQKQINNTNNPDKITSQPTSITNENFHFANNITKPIPDGDNIKSLEDTKLQSPVESHFALTPASSSATSSPANGFISHDCTDILKEELDQLEEGTLKVEKMADDSKGVEFTIENTVLVESLLSPTDENINMFSLEGKEAIEKCSKGSGDAIKNVSEVYQGEVGFQIIRLLKWLL